MATPGVASVMRVLLACCLAARGAALTAGSGMAPAVRLRPIATAKSAWAAGSFREFMQQLRHVHGDAILIDLWPVLPPTYLLMGKTANRGVLAELDSGLDQVLQELINILPVDARIPHEEDKELQRQVATLFNSVRFVDGRMPSFFSSARSIRDRWTGHESPPQPPPHSAEPGGAPPSQQPATPGESQPQRSGGGLKVFHELSEYVLRADLEVLFGKRFCERHAPVLTGKFEEWVRNIANGQLVGFFTELGDLLREEVRERRAAPAEYAGEESVLSVYLASGAVERHDEQALVGLLCMTLMAATFNTQVSLAWILVHLYRDESLLRRAREEIASCDQLSSYEEISQLPCERPALAPDARRARGRAPSPPHPPPPSPPPVPSP